ncbi:MAG: hypothetical protein CMJ18_19975 [Phycisphaeraceae bacterium]|nr:hypothetical protein [Phycisphaeraceae bacterium]
MRYPISRFAGTAALGACLALGMIVSTWIGARTVLRIKVRDTTIRVKGFAERRIDADIAVWSGDLTTRDADLATAMAQMEAHRARLLDYLATMGFEHASVGVAAVGIDKLYRTGETRMRTNEIEQYVLKQHFEVKAGDVRRIAATATQSSGLLKEGIELASQTPRYLFTRLNDLKLDLLEEATRNARARAERLIAGSGSRIGMLRKASQGVFQITPAHSTRVSDYGENDTTRIEKSVRAVVTIEYEVE